MDVTIEGESRNSTLNELDVTIAGESRNSSCLGENVTYICTVPALSHTWSIPALQVTASITVQTPFSSVPPFVLSLISFNDASITSSLSVIAVVALNNSIISCTDSTGETQQTTGRVLSKLLKH